MKNRYIYFVIYLCLLILFVLLYITQYTRVLNVRKSILSVTPGTNERISLPVVDMRQTTQGIVVAGAYGMEYQLPRVASAAPGQVIGLLPQVSTPISNLKLATSYQITLNSQSFSYFCLTNCSGFDLFSRLYIKLYQLQTKFVSKMYSFLSPSQVHLLVGVLLGKQDQLSPEEKQLFRRAGISHVLVASGYNVTIIASLCYAIIRKIFSIRKTISIAIICIFLQLFVIGFEPSIVRATLMASLLFVGKWFGRQGSAFMTLVFAGAIMALIEPFIIFSLSFQLSFLATLALLCFSDRASIQKKTDQRPFLSRVSLDLVNDAVLPFFAVTLFILPLQLGVFGEFTLVGLLSSFLLLWMVPIMMAMGSVFCLSLFLHPIIASVIAVPTAFMLQLFWNTVVWLGNVPYGQVQFGKPSIIGLSIYYIFLGFYFLFQTSKREVRPLGMSITKKH